MVFPQCSPDALEPSARFAKIEELLKQWMADGHIICLQEVSRAWADGFVCTVLAHGYTPMFAGYGSPRDGYMGVFTAWNSSKYTLKKCCTDRLCDIMRLSPPPKQPESYLTSLWRQVSSYVWGPVVVAEDPVKLTCRRFNRVLITNLKTLSGREFAVVNYHMPCKFEDQAFMAYHVGLLLHCFPTVPRIFVGDFNIAPSTESYQKMRIVTSDHELEAPGFTCWSYNPRNGPFKGQLDYIIPFGFGVSRWINYVEPTQGPLPTVEHPSDHLPLIKEVTFK